MIDANQLTDDRINNSVQGGKRQGDILRSTQERAKDSFYSFKSIIIGNYVL